MLLSLILAAATAVAPAAADLIDKHVVSVGVHDDAETARSAAKTGSWVLDSSKFSGIEPGKFLVVESVHGTFDEAKARCGVLLSVGTPCSLWSTRERIGERPSIEKAAQIALEGAPDGAAVDFAGSIPARGESFPVVVLSHPVEGILHEEFGALESDYRTTAFVFLSETPLEVPENEFLKSGSDTWIDVSCKKPRFYPLGGEMKAPIILAQRCMVGERLEYRFLVFDDTIVPTPEAGIAVWENTGSPLDKHVLFVPGEETLPPLVEKERGDGRTILAGVEGGRKKGDEENVWVREIRGFWSNARMGYRYSIWERADQKDNVPDWWKRTDIGLAVEDRQAAHSPSK